MKKLTCDFDVGVCFKYFNIYLIIKKSEAYNSSRLSTKLFSMYSEIKEQETLKDRRGVLGIDFRHRFSVPGIMKSRVTGNRV